MALLLQANPNLKWRDVQHLIVHTSRTESNVVNPAEAEWVMNAAGLSYSTAFGFGLLDAEALVNLAKKWKNVPEVKYCTHDTFTKNVIVEPEAEASVQLFVDPRECPIEKLEHVVIRLTVEANKRGDVEAILTSPSNTTITLLASHPYTHSPRGYPKTEFLSVATWDENPQGNWTLTIVNKGKIGGVYSQPLKLVDATIKAYGTVGFNAAKFKL